MGSLSTKNRRSQLAGVARELPPPADAAERQLALPIAAASAPALPCRHEILPGAVHVPGWLDLEAQRELVRQFRLWVLPPAGLRQPRMPSGHVMSVQAVCLGWHWYPYVYSKTADDTDGAPVKPIPPSLVALARAAVAAAYGEESRAAAEYAPDAVMPRARRGVTATV